MYKTSIILHFNKPFTTEIDLWAIGDRYQHYISKKYKGIWCLRIQSYDGEKWTAQLIDKQFDPPCGRVPSDAPIIFIWCKRDLEKICITFSLEWKKWKLILVALAVAMLTLLAYYHISFSILYNTSSLVSAIILYLLLFLCGLRWIIKNVKHDCITMEVLQEILCK